MMKQSIFDMAMDRCPANFMPLSPVGFLRRAAGIYPEKVAIIDGALAFTYAEFHQRSRRLAALLRARGIAAGQTVAVISPNTHMMLEAHFGVPMAGAVLNAINTRLDADAVTYMLEHGEARLLMADESCRALAERCASAAGVELLVGKADYEQALASAKDGVLDPALPNDEWDAIALNYTSGTTGRPKGVVYTHRGAFLNAMSNALSLGLSPGSVYLWTLPMFHCNGWTHPWAVTLMGGTHICLRDIVAENIFDHIMRHDVTHFSAAPVVLNLLANAASRPSSAFDRPVRVATGGAPPPQPVIQAMEEIGIAVTHLYGQTESYGPSLMCFEQADWRNLPLAERSALMARQGAAMPAIGAAMVADPNTGRPVPADGKTLGEIMVRGNTVMKGYLKNAEATASALHDGWLRSGDLAVMYADGYIKIRDRSKDIIVSGGENISSVEIETVLYRHPSVQEVAVVAKPDEKWGETPCAFVTLKTGAPPVTAETIIAWCRGQLAHFKCPRHVIFGELPKTATGKIRKVELRDRAKWEA